MGYFINLVCIFKQIDFNFKWTPGHKIVRWEGRGEY